MTNVANFTLKSKSNKCMLSQFISALFNTIFARIANTFNGWSHVKFYFITGLIFFFSLAFIYRDSITMSVQTVIYNQIQFRECRDVIGLQKAFDGIIAKDTIIQSYGVYLYQPINNAFYKRVVLTNSENVMRSPSLQGIYLRDQPTLTAELKQNDYYIVDQKEAVRHPDLQYMIDISTDVRMFYALKLDGKLIGEIGVRFKHPPSTTELEQVLKDLSPLLYEYIV
jgi:hypothetical protein